MIENEIGYRGSKSEIIILQPNKVSVKEQRVDDSWEFNKNFLNSLRCILIKAFLVLFLKKLPNQTVHHSSLYSKLTDPSRDSLRGSVACAASGKVEKLNRHSQHAARFFSTKAQTTSLVGNLSPFFITGLTDAEGSFTCIIKKNEAYKAG